MSTPIYEDNWALVALTDDRADENDEFEFEKWEREHFIPTHCDGPEQTYQIAKVYQCSHTRCKEIARWTWENKFSPRAFDCPTCEAPEFAPCRVLEGKRKGKSTGSLGIHAARWEVARAAKRAWEIKHGEQS